MTVATSWVSVGSGRRGKQKKAEVHRLVLESFVGWLLPGCECEHLNGDKTDNRLTNLEWVTGEVNRRRYHVRAAAA